MHSYKQKPIGKRTVVSDFNDVCDVNTKLSEPCDRF